MDLIVKSRNGKVSDRQRHYIEDKLGKLARFLDQINNATVEVSTEQRRDQGEVSRVQVTLVGEHGIILRAEEHGSDLYSAIDNVKDILERQIKRYKEKHWRRGKMRRQGGDFVDIDVESAALKDRSAAAPAVEGVAEDLPRIVRTKEFKLTPMYTDEAVEQMELLGHTFFIFRDADTSQISVVYRRKDGNYGLLLPKA